MDLLDDIKGDIKEGQYLELCKELKSLNIKFSKVYKFTYIKQTKVFDTDTTIDDTTQTWKILMEKRTEIVKIEKCNFHHQNDDKKFEEEVKYFIKTINDLNYANSFYFTNIGMARRNNDIASIFPCDRDLQRLNNRKLKEMKGDDYDSDEDDMYIEINDIIPLSIEELN